MEKPRKKFAPVGSALDDLRSMPEEVQDAIGGALGLVQDGQYPEAARPYGEGLPREIYKIAVHEEGEEYRAAFVIEFAEIVYLLDVLHKKSKKGKGTPQPDLNRILKRYKAAREHYQTTFKKKNHG